MGDSKTTCQEHVESSDLEAALLKLQVEKDHAHEAASSKHDMDLESGVPAPRQQRWVPWVAPTALIKLVTSVTTAASSLTGSVASADGMRCAKPLRFAEDMV